MAKFNEGTTVICSITVTNSVTGALTNPATSMTIGVKDAGGAAIVAAGTAMTNDSTGKYHYDFTSTGVAIGTYAVTYTATDGTRVTVVRDTFVLE